MKKSYFGLVLALVVGLTFLPGVFVNAASPVDVLQIYTEEYAPFNMEVNGKLVGIGPDLMVEMLKRTGSTLGLSDIKLRPWAQGYQKVQTDVNTCLFSTTRTAARENLFKWVGPLAPTIIGIAALKTKNIKINSVEDVKKYKTGVINADIGELLLTTKGVDKSQLDGNADLQAIFNKIKMGRIDLFSYEQNVVFYELKTKHYSGFNPDDFETVFVLEKGDVYFALQKNTDDVIVNALQKALDSIKSDGTYQKILNAYK